MTLCNLVRVKGHRNNLKAKEAVPLVTYLYSITLNCVGPLVLKVHYFGIEIFVIADVTCFSAHWIVKLSTFFYVCTKPYNGPIGAKHVAYFQNDILIIYIWLCLMAVLLI
jgi:hypothetical protein